jgi:hypothetical protein
MRRTTWKSNCFFFAWYLYFFRFPGKGYCALRPSRHFIGMHWVWIPFKQHRRNSIVTIHYHPINPKCECLLAAFDKLWYNGRIRTYDESPH